MYAACAGASRPGRKAPPVGNPGRTGMPPRRAPPQADPYENDSGMAQASDFGVVDRMDLEAMNAYDSGPSAAQPARGNAGARVR